MKTFFLFFTLMTSLAGQAYAQGREIYDCDSGGVGMRLTYVMSPISNDQFRMDVNIANPFSNDINGVFTLSKLNDYGLAHYRGSGKLSNGSRLNAEIIVDYGRPHELILTGFSHPTKYSITFGCY